MKMKRWFKIILIVLAVLLLCLSLAAGYVWYSKSQNLLEESLRNKLKDTGSYLYRGLFNSEKPEYFNHAIEEYKAILKAKPGQKDALQGLAEAYNQQKDYEAAEKLYKELIAVEPENAAAYLNLGFHYLRRNMIKEALAQARIALVYDQKSQRAHVLNALAYENQGDIVSAIAEYKKAIACSEANKKKTEQDAYIYFGLAGIFQKAGLVYDAAGQYEKVIRFWPFFADGYIMLADFYDGLDMFDKELSVLNLALKSNRKDARIYIGLGRVYFKKMDFEAAYTYFKMAQSLGANVKDEFLENINKFSQGLKQVQQGKTK